MAQESFIGMMRIISFSVPVHRQFLDIGRKVKAISHGHRLHDVWREGHVTAIEASSSFEFGADVLG